MGYFVQIRTSNLNEVQPYQKKVEKLKEGEYFCTALDFLA